MTSLLNLLFGCSHNRTTFPLTRKRREGPYVVCLKCAKEFKYDWEQMRVCGPRERTEQRHIKQEPLPVFFEIREKTRSERGAEELEEIVGWRL